MSVKRLASRCACCSSLLTCTQCDTAQSPGLKLLLHGLQLLPYFHFYRGAEGRVAAFTASISKLQRLRYASGWLGGAGSVCCHGLAGQRQVSVLQRCHRGAQVQFLQAASSYWAVTGSAYAADFN